MSNVKYKMHGYITPQVFELVDDEVRHLKRNKCTSVICSDITGHVLCGIYHKEK